MQNRIRLMNFYEKINFMTYLIILFKLINFETVLGDACVVIGNTQNTENLKKKRKCKIYFRFSVFLKFYKI